MSGRRGPHEGSIFQRASDGRWVGSVHVGYDAGKRVRKVVYGKTRKEVANKLSKALREAQAGTLVLDERRTVGDYLTWWVTNVAPATVKDSTADQYAWIVKRYLDPHLGKVKLAKLGPLHVQQMLASMEKEGLSAATRRQTRAILRRALGHAERYGYVARNAAALVDCPRDDGPRLDDTLSLDDATRLLGAAPGDPLEALVTVALTVGLRKGEALALTWENIDLDARTLTVAATLTRRTGYGLVVGTPKTDRSRRTVALPSTCVKALQAHRRRQAADRLAAGDLWHPGGFVFTTPTGTPLDPRNVTRDFQALCTRARVGPRRFHALRHSAATLMLAQGVPLEVISKTLGHSGLAITADVYAKVGVELQRQAADAIDDLFSAG